MRDYARGAQRIALTLMAGLLLACPTALAQAHSAQASDNYAFRGTITGTGDIRDASGNVVGRAVMTNPGARFEVSTMSINAQGNVVDANGMSVGRVVLNTNAPGSAAPSASVAPQSTQSYSSTSPTYNTAPPTYIPPPQGYNAPPPAYSSTPRSVMTNTGQRIIFDTNEQMDMSKLTMDKEGRVFDVNGRVVGHITTPNAGRSDGLERGVSPPLVTSPPPNSSYQRAEVPQYSKRTQESSAVVEKSRKSADKAAARAAKAGLLASREADLAARRSKVENRIRSEHQGGRLSNEQMNELMSSLQSTIQTEQDFKRDKKLKDREMLFLYRKWDSIMGDVDDDLKKNARSAVGLRTR